MWRACSLYHVPTRNHNEGGHIPTQADDRSEETCIMFVEAADQMLLCRSACEVHGGTDLALSQEVWWQDEISK